MIYYFLVDHSLYQHHAPSSVRGWEGNKYGWRKFDSVWSRAKLEQLAGYRRVSALETTLLFPAAML